jgi:membrane protease YdiL (CAAX protease family)
MISSKLNIFDETKTKMPQSSISNSNIPLQRLDLLGSASILLVVATLAASGPAFGLFWPWLAIPALFGMVLGLVSKNPVALHVALMAGLTVAAQRLPSFGECWALPFAIALVVYAAIVYSIPWLRKNADWFRRGRIERVDVALIIGFSIIAGISLIIWRFTTDTDLTRYRGYVPDVPIWLMPIGIVVTAMINAAFEEALWRGVIQHGLHEVFGIQAVAFVLQAVAFGLWHFIGFPSEWVGVGLATIFAAMMGVLRWRSQGMLSPWIAHVLADVTISVLVVIMVLT